MEEKIKISYKGAVINYDSDKEEWYAKLNEDLFFEDDVLKSDKSLQKVKDAVDRFNKRNFQEISVLFFQDGEMKNAEIISFTETSGECWIRHCDGRREKIQTVKSLWFLKPKRFYACDNVINPSTLTKIAEVNDEIKKMEEELLQKKRERIHLIDSLQEFDITGYVLTADVED